MLFTESLLTVADNSGGVLVKCIKVPGSSRPRSASIGDIIVVSTRKIKPKPHIKEAKQIKKGKVYKAIVIRTKKPKIFKDGSSIQFSANNVVILRKDSARTFGGPKLAGSRVFGPIAYDLKLKKKFPKLFSLASHVFH